MTSRRPLEQLVDPKSTTWAEITTMIARSPSRCLIVAADATSSSTALENLQVTTRTYLGAMVWHCGFIAIDDNWLRLLGAGNADIPAPHEQTFPGDGSIPRFTGIAVAFDVLGGVFAIHGSGLQFERGTVLYWAPDTLSWTALGVGHSGFVAAAVSGQLAAFYEGLRWPGWEAECRALNEGQGLSAYPPPFTKEGKNWSSVSRRAAPLTEVVRLSFEYGRQVGALPAGSQFDVRVDQADDSR
jgi:hypothetical protein